MKRFSILAALGAITLVAFAVTVPTTAETRNWRSPHGAALDTSLRASHVVGMSIRSLQGQKIGTVNDIVLDAESGQVRYVAISHGGFLGMGDKLIAVPWAVFELRQEANDGGRFLLLNVPEAKLKGAPGFNEDHWPNFTDREFTGMIDTHFGVDVEVGRRGGVDVGVGRRGGINVEVGPGGVDVDVGGNR